MISLMRPSRRTRSLVLRMPFSRRDSAISKARCSRRIRRAPIAELLEPEGGYLPAGRGRQAAPERIRIARPPRRGKGAWPTSGKGVLSHQGRGYHVIEAVAAGQDP